MGRREGPGKTHHSVGSAGWLALAGRSRGRSRADAKKEKSASATFWSPGPRPRTDPGPGLPRPKQPVNKPTSSLPPAPLLRRPLRALGIAAGGCSNGTPWPPRGAVPAPASGALGPAAAWVAKAAMRADSPRLPGGGGTSAPSGGGGHVGPGHVIHCRRATGVKVQDGVGADRDQETAARTRVAARWGRPGVPPTARKAYPRQLAEAKSFLSLHAPTHRRAPSAQSPGP